eukprot:gnl/MRDRNA2_/MRDRNA2_113060_c0_seq1.p1 gnl/MRDRNA2_/MRDRNA2_113060_c0~~gnl/MRDRNA2_/MRDRNA2_113060_c0_seq1.p1  ORF type:complete len:651 (+),score=131.82 gnl/MRDRNA2_/MRDRNA2_113060_c0_seq1:137-2089(+)
MTIITGIQEHLAGAGVKRNKNVNAWAPQMRPKFCDGWILGGRGPPQSRIVLKFKSDDRSATNINGFPAAQPWHDRHQVSNSKDNSKLPRQRRDYFDELPSLRVSNGKYYEVPQHNVSNKDAFAWTTPVDQFCQLQTRFQKYPYRLQPGQQRLKTQHVADPDWANEFKFDDDVEKIPVDLLLKAIPSNEDSSQLAAKGAGGRRKSLNPQVSAEELELQGTMNKQVAASERARSEFSSVSGQEQFRTFSKWCMSKYGSLIRCWRMIDSDGNMTISRTEFFSQLAAMKYPGDTKELWRLLDRDHSNNLSFLHFDPESAMMLASFKKIANQKFGSIADLCNSIDTDRNGKLSFNEFLEGCNMFDLTDVQASLWCIFKMFGLCSDRNAAIAIKDIGFLDMWDCPEYLLVKPDVEGLENWKSVMMRRHKGNGICAWRRDLDKDGSMRVNWLEFKHACIKVQNQISEKINISGVWRALDDNLSGWLSLREFDEHSYEIMSRFKRMADQQAGSVADFIQQIDPKKPGAEITKSMFVRALKKTRILYQFAGMSEMSTIAEEIVEMDSDEELEQRIKTRSAVKKKRRSTILEQEEDLADMLFQGLDIENSGSINPNKVRWMDHWNVDEEEAEEEAWKKLLEARQKDRDEERHHKEVTTPS